MSRTPADQAFTEIASAMLVFILYVALFELTDIFGGATVFGTASPIFLPAFVRLFGVLIARSLVIPALFAAAFICVDLGLEPGQRAIVALFLATGAPLAIMATSKLLHLNPTLENLTPSRLLMLSIAAGLGNSVFYNLSLWIVGLPFNPFMAHLVTFIGDVIGTWVIIYLIKMFLHLWWKGRS
jgi:hypothetical protein